jgi:hypothetical protein
MKYYGFDTPVECPIKLQFLGDQLVDQVRAYGEYFGKNDDGVSISAQEVSYHSIWGQTGRLCLLGQHPAKAG